MKLYHKIFKSRDDMSVYLENMDPLISYDEELFNRLTSARNTDELHDAKCAVLRDFHDIYTFDASDAEFPEPVGHFDDRGRKDQVLAEENIAAGHSFLSWQRVQKVPLYNFIRRIIDCRRSN